MKVIDNTLLREKLFSYYYIVYCEPLVFSKTVVGVFVLLHEVRDSQEGNKYCERNISAVISNSVCACPTISTPSKALATPIPVVQSPIAKDVALAEVPDDIDTFISSIPDELLLFPRKKQSSARAAPLPNAGRLLFQPVFTNCQNITINFC